MYDLGYVYVKEYLIIKIGEEIKKEKG